jgi:hypothetical protein
VLCVQSTRWRALSYLTPAGGALRSDTARCAAAAATVAVAAGAYALHQALPVLFGTAAGTAAHAADAAAAEATATAAYTTPASAMMPALHQCMHYVGKRYDAASDAQLQPESSVTAAAGKRCQMTMPRQSSSESAGALRICISRPLLHADDAPPCCCCCCCCFVSPPLQDFRVPREIVWLNGAPGSGKVGTFMHHFVLCGPVWHCVLSGCPLLHILCGVWCLQHRAVHKS